ncbi:hypothetical protein SAMN03080615_01677 [Amphritea atlantica]|uniref:Uncharacterized protein n=1 Tax=Amphritea atlantica TaxID=355243 RepID=A0A1H9GH10_9GAMM|nr:hypothetical protein [Amphritea atlantica]SEQ49392.1 hypothetical protein SAMN03080615_01677 [Amphritea atlantica]
MSKTAESTRQRLVQSIRRIAKTEFEENQRLGPAAPKARIGKTRGAAYLNANGEIATGDDVPDDAPIDSADKASDAAQNDSGTVKKKNYQSISDADNAQVGDTFDQFKGVDCTTGEAVKIDLTPLDGNEYVPPDGWADADSPPVPDDYIEGEYWRTGLWFGSYYYGATAGEACSLIGGTYDASSGQCAGTEYGYHSVDHYPCGSSTAPYCTISPVPTSWPSDNTTDLVLKNGAFQAHPMDPDAAEAFKTSPPAEVEICDGQGNRYSVTALEGGGAMVTKLDGNGDPVADGRSLVIDKAGVVKQRIMNSWRDSYL